MMSKKNLILLINSSKFILICNFIILFSVILVSNKIHSNQKIIYVELAASKEINYQLRKIINTSFEKQNEMVFNKLKKIFEEGNHKIYLINDTYNSDNETLGVSFAYEITPKLFSSYSFSINEDKVFSKLDTYLNEFSIRYIRELNDSLRNYRNWQEFYSESLNDNFEVSLYRILKSSLYRTEFEILKLEHLINQFDIFDKTMKDKRNYTLEIKESKNNFKFTNTIELVIVYLIVFNTIILILRKYKIKI